MTWFEFEVIIEIEPAANCVHQPNPSLMNLVLYGAGRRENQRKVKKKNQMNSHQIVLPQVELQYSILDGGKYKTNILRILLKITFHALS